MKTSLLNELKFSPAFISQNDIAGKESILKVLAYFDIFRHPLTSEEISQFMDHPATGKQVEQWLSELLHTRHVFRHQSFYSLQDNPLVVHRRNEGRQRALPLLKKAKKIGRFLYRFPFVRAVAISGSLSKNFADEKADIDFFIITRANRLWLARTIMHLYKKLTFLTGRQHYYCMNYYIDEEALLLEEKNIFTAIELKTLLPVSGKEVTQHFFRTNQWADEWLPSCEYKQQESKDPNAGFFKRAVEWILRSNAGNALDRLLMRKTNRRWRRKEKKGAKNKKGQPMGLITGVHFARSDPGNFQAKVLELYEQKTREIFDPSYAAPVIAASVK